MSKFKKGPSKPEGTSHKGTRTDSIKGFGDTKKEINNHGGAEVKLRPTTPPKKSDSDKK